MLYSLAYFRAALSRCILLAAYRSLLTAYCQLPSSQERDANLELNADEREANLLLNAKERDANLHINAEARRELEERLNEALVVSKVVEQ